MLDPKDRVYDSLVFVDKVHYDGVGRTKAASLDTLSRHIFRARTLRELVLSCYAVKCYMEELALFRNVSVSIEPSTKYRNAVEVVYSGNEPSRLKARADVSVGEGGQINTGAQLNSVNVSGRGDNITMAVSLSGKKASVLDLQYMRPWLSHPGSYVGFDLFRNLRLMPQCNAVASENGVSVNFWQQWTNTVAYSARLMDCWRYFSTESMNFLIREHAGHNVKVSFEHSLHYNTEDNKVLPTKGTFAKFGQEFARFWGDAVFTKYQLDVRRHFRLPFGFFTSYGCSFTQFTPESRRTLAFVDRTFLGGSTNLRGFCPNKVGTCVDDGSYVGGTGSVCLTAHIFRPILNNFLYGHAFLCAGSIWHTPYANPLTKAWHEITVGSRRSSAGIGLLFKLGNYGRIEVNYCWPIELSDNDKAQKGLQLGVGASFL